MADKTDSITFEVNTLTKVEVTTLHVNARVRYWEYATVNGIEDAAGTLIPFRDDDCWRPSIDLATGRIIGWPAGTKADIHYEVCDDGEYWLTRTEGNRLVWKGHCVPDDLLCPTYSGYGDYIIMKVDGDGLIEGWRVPPFDGSKWEFGDAP